MARNDSLFILSGFISLSLFTFFLALFLYMLFSASKITNYAMQKDKFISVSVDIPKTATKKVKKNVITPTEESHSKAEAKEVDIGNLFSKVVTKDITKKKEVEKFDNKRTEEIQKKVETKTENKVESVLEKINNIDAAKVDTEDNPISTAEEVNEYLAKIQALVYKYFNPPKNSEGNTVRVVIELNAIGKVVDFRILNYSSSQALNEECDRIKTRLMGVLFPVNPENKSSSTIVNITSDKNEN